MYIQTIVFNRGYVAFTVYIRTKIATEKAAEKIIKDYGVDSETYLGKLFSTGKLSSISSPSSTD